MKITYDIYKVNYWFDGTFDKNMDSEDIYDIVTGEGEWIPLANFTDENKAWDKWHELSEFAEIREDVDGLIYSCVMILERSERNDDGLIIESVEWDYAVGKYEGDEYDE